MYRCTAFALCLVLPAAQLPATRSTQRRITTPKQHFGFNLGDDYCLANYEQYADYWRSSRRNRTGSRSCQIGDTAEKRRQLMAIVTSPANHKKLDR